VSSETLSEEQSKATAADNDIERYELYPKVDVEYSVTKAELHTGRNSESAHVQMWRKRNEVENTKRYKQQSFPSHVGFHILSAGHPLVVEGVLRRLNSCSC